MEAFALARNKRPNHHPTLSDLLPLLQASSQVNLSPLILPTSTSSRRRSTTHGPACPPASVGEISLSASIACFLIQACKRAGTLEEAGTEHVSLRGAYSLLASARR